MASEFIAFTRQCVNARAKPSGDLAISLMIVLARSLCCDDIQRDLVVL